MIRRTLLALAFLLATTSCGGIPGGADNRPILAAWVAVAGKSMLPTFPEYCIVQMEIGVAFDDLKAGDTVIFWDYKRGPRAFTHHRLVAKQGDAWIAQGDNPDTNPVADRSWVTRDNFYARTTGLFVVPGTEPPPIQVAKPRTKFF